MSNVPHSSRISAMGALPLLLLLLSGAIGLADGLWTQKAGFAVAGRAYAGLTLATALFFGLGYFYEKWRQQDMRCRSECPRCHWQHPKDSQQRQLERLKTPLPSFCRDQDQGWG
ncbi:MAG: hypothetical protein ABI450_10350, partial [Rhizomicrobium sp.]